MNETHHEEHHMYRLAKNRFVVLIIATLIVSFGLVAIALGLYASSGAAQVDLSRPGYSGVRNQISDDADDSAAFPSDGPINKGVLDKFEARYDATADDITRVNAFDPEVLSDKSLRISGDTNTN